MVNDRLQRDIAAVVADLGASPLGSLVLQQAGEDYVDWGDVIHLTPEWARKEHGARGSWRFGSGSKDCLVRDRAGGAAEPWRGN